MKRSEAEISVMPWSNAILAIPLKIYDNIQDMEPKRNNIITAINRENIST